jgi:hypothetical protein
MEAIRVPDETELYLLASREVQEALADNNIDITELLRSEGLQVATRQVTDPSSAARGAKEPVTLIILATSGAALALTPLLQRVLATLTRKRVLVTEKVLIPVEDSGHQVVLDENGHPILQWIDRARFVESGIDVPHHKIAIQGQGLAISYEEHSES